MIIITSLDGGQRARNADRIELALAGTESEQQRKYGKCNIEIGSIKQASKQAGVVSFVITIVTG